MYYIKDLQNNEVLEFTSLYKIEKFLNMKTLLKTKDAERKRVIQNRYMLSLDLDFTKERKRAKKIVNWVVFDNDVKSEYECTAEELYKKLDITFNIFRQGVNKNVLMKNRFKIYTKGNEINHLPRKVRKEREPIRKNIFIFDTLLKSINEVYLSLQEVADKYGLMKYEVVNAISQKQLIRDRYYINYENNFTMRKKKYKKTNAQLKNKKIDLDVNGEFTYKEPNKPTVRLGKLGIDGIKNRFK